MRKLKQLSMVVLLMLMLATGTFAGIIQTGAASPEPPPTTDPGIIQTGSPTPSDQQNSPTPSDTFEGVALNLLQSLLSVF
jgi:hypothetical protein